MAPPDLVINPRGGRSLSISSDRQTPSSTGYGGLLSPPALITPDPAFIAASAASQIVTNDHDSQADSWLDQHGIEPSGETALVAQPALRLVNRFLDQLLFNILAIAKSTSLSSLRPAVSEVLKPKLAKDAINGADQELHEYLGGEDDETIMAYHNGLEAAGNWDLELIWKRTRLRCMVYSSLGDMEEEDEDFYTEREHLDPTGAIQSQFTPSSGVVSPAVAIFLTSILEFIGEHVLVVAGQAAYQRLKSKYEKEAKDGTSTPADIADRVVVGDSDMERVALDRTLGRLWRGWKKRIRSPTESISISRSFSRETLNAQLQHSRTTSISPDETIDENARRPSLTAVLAELAEFELATSIPLPMNDNDIREIEIPGLALQREDAELDISPSDEDAIQPRAKSMIFFGKVPLTPTSPRSEIAPLSMYRKRANSLPTPEPSPYNPKRHKDSNEDLREDAVKKIGEDEVAKDNTIESESKAEEQEAESGESKGLVAGDVADVAVVGAIAGASIDLAKGDDRQIELETKSEIEPEEEAFIEEPEEEVQILTSSRVSFGAGCISPDDLKGLSRHSSVRSQSNHSVRVIDVSRPTSTQPGLEVQQLQRIASPISRTASASPHSRNATASLHARNSAGASIIEEKEAYESENEIMTAVPADLAAAMQGVDVDPSPTSQHFYSNEGSRANTPQSPPSVFTAAPPARHPKHTSQAKSPISDYQPDGRSGGATKSPTDDNSTAPALTPLREIAEEKIHTSDTASPSSAHGYESQTGERPVHDHSSSASVSTQRQIPLRSINTNIQRESPPRTRDEVIRKVSTRRSTASGSDTASQKFVPQRTSEESSSAGDKGRSFEQLIRSDQTIQYTLTPETMRNIEAVDSPSSRNSIKAYGVPRPTTGRSRSSSASKFNGLRANPPEASAPNPAFQPATRSATGGSRLRSNLPQARDARVDTNSIGDFAEFIRSTGPANSYDQAPYRTAQTHRGTNGTARNTSGSVPRNNSQASIPRRSASSAGRKKLQARDAVVPRGDSISDLIDFVRSGPQVGASGGHRISRTVAPFRTTMDSDQMVGAVGGKAVDASFQDARYSAASNSVVSSVTSSTGLLKNAALNKSASSQRPDFDEEDRMPKRKTRRVRDPYAIDLSDDEEDYIPSPRAKPIQEESLADFLRDVPPPPEATATSVFDSVPKPINKDIKKKSSAPSLMSRFGRKDSTATPLIPKPKAPSAQNSRSGSRQDPVPQTITAKYNTITPHQQSNGNNYASQADSARNRIPRKAYQPRDPLLSSSNRTSDLADFLMRSEPPSGAQAQPQTFTPTLQKEEGSAFQRMFGRKKVH